MNIEIILKTLFHKLDQIKAQNPRLYEHLNQIMKSQGVFYQEDTIIYDYTAEVDRAFFISEGFITRSSINQKKRKQLLAIYEAGEIKAGPDFMEQRPSEFIIEAVAGTFVAYITYEQMKIVYKKFPEVHELAALIMSGLLRKEAHTRKLLLHRGIELVYAFYQQFPAMTKPGSVLSDARIASYLRISVNLLRLHRGSLFKSRKLINPVDRKNSI